MRAFATTVLLVSLAVVPAPATAATTVDQIVALAKAGVTDAVILALIERDRTIFTLEPEQLIALKREGLSEAVVIAMLKSGRAEGEEAARAESEYRNATIAASLAPGPEVLIIGHGPDRPNTAHRDGFWTSRLFSPTWAAPFVTPYAAPYTHTSEYFYGVESSYPVARLVQRQDRRLCYAQVASAASRGNALTFVTECPAVMQRSLKRSSR